MNILLINHYAGSPDMGREYRPYYLAREWVKNGNKVDIIAADYSHLRRKNPEIERDFQKVNIDDINYYFLKSKSYQGNGAKRAMTMSSFVHKLLRKAKWIVDNLEPDVVICSSTYPIDTYAGQKIRKLSKKKVMLIHEVHDMWPLTLYEIGGMSKKNPFVTVMQAGENSAYKNSDKVVSLLNNAEPYMRKHGLKEGNFYCIPNGVILEEWENPLKIPDEHREVLTKLREEGKFIVGYTGGHGLSNALDILLKAAEKSTDPDVHFVLVGDGLEKPKLMEEAKEMGLTNLTFLPQIKKKAVPDLYKYFDCNYMGGRKTPLYRQGLCLNKMFDTMAAGKVGICAYGVKTYFSEYGCGVDINPDSDSILKAVNSIKNMDKDKLKTIGDRGLKASRERFNYEKLAEEFYKLMEQEVK